MLFGRIAKLTAAAALGFGLLAGAASAATVINLTGSRANLGASETYSVDDLTLEVTSFGGNIHRNGNGLGVSSNPDRNRLGSNRNTNESLTFSFSQSVTLLGGIVFEHRNGFEMFEILDGDGNILAVQRIMGDGGSTAVTLDPLNLEGDTFTFRHLSGSGIRINQLTVTAVPLPAALPMALVAFGGLMLVGRRRRKAV